MTRGETRIRNQKGLHLRSAGIFVQRASQFASRILVGLPDQPAVDGKSILGLATLGAARGTPIIITAEGPDEARAVRELVQLVDHGFHED
jgi:phosphocarrier protein HPr